MLEWGEGEQGETALKEQSKDCLGTLESPHATRPSHDLAICH